MPSPALPITGMKGDYGRPMALCRTCCGAVDAGKRRSEILNSEYAAGGETNEWKGTASCSSRLAGLSHARLKQWGGNTAPILEPRGAPNVSHVEPKAQEGQTQPAARRQPGALCGNWPPDARDGNEGAARRGRQRQSPTPPKRPRPFPRPTDRRPDGWKSW